MINLFKLILKFLGFKVKSDTPVIIDDTQNQIDYTPDPPKKDDFQILLELHNSKRLNNGSSQLSFDENLIKSAQKHAQRMADLNSMFHGNISFPGFTMTGENVAYGYNDPTNIFGMWFKSIGHRSNILNRSFNSVGFGKATSKTGVIYWCAQFGRK